MAEEAKHTSAEYIQEPPRQTIVRARADVLVAGGGPGGVTAAVAAARNGAKVILLERYGNLGGNMGVEYASFPGTPSGGIGFQGVSGKRIVGGLGWEWMQRVKERGGAVGPVPRTVISSLPGGWLKFPNEQFGPKVDVETVQSVAMELVREAGVKLFLHAWAVDAITVDGVVKGVIIQSKAGREAIMADVVVDATADADLAASAGAPWEKSPRRELYRMAVEVVMGNVDLERARQFVLNHRDQFVHIAVPTDETQIPAGLQKPLRADMELGERGDVKVSDDGLVLTASRPRASIGIGIRPGISAVFSGFNGDPTDLEDLTEAEIVGKERALRSVEWLRKNIPGFENCYMVYKSPLGTRESRRIVGEYMLTEDDLRQGRRFEDAIGQNIMPFDRHQAGGDFSYELLTRPHDIPYRCLVPKKVDNLLVAGRSISCDHVAQSSLRKWTACMTTGEAAGTAAALATQAVVTARRVNIAALQDKLHAQGALWSGQEAAETDYPLPST